MAPMLARDQKRRGRPHWIYESMYGRTGVLIANVAVILSVAWALSR
jgi:hypothetical protein